MLPHLSYADAVHAALVDAGIAPDTLTASAPDTDDRRELIAVFSWTGITLRWSSETGWRHEAQHRGGPLSVDQFAAPAAVATAVALLADGRPPVKHRERWTGARSLAVAIGDWEQTTPPSLPLPTRSRSHS
ncbi:hypothetical protein [Streptomyces sp. NBC_00233]|uniref:hypothetical protein n=1 Tax=Streptomyces sp. NBC_00233 TaxID=2975686 RepID=UPI0022513F31|nr:hypothetical protein [Streptomyces sp. NBC_00233]MCX5233065.1 hypothetical protein [Streptomyces sp. NBC_00233]